MNKYDFTTSQIIESSKIDVSSAQEIGISIPRHIDFVHNDMYIKLSIPEGSDFVLNEFYLLDRVVLIRDDDPHEIISSHTHDIIRDCPLSNESSNKPIIFREVNNAKKVKTSMLIPIQFFFRQKMKINVSDTQQFLIKVSLCDRFLKDNEKILQDLHVSLNYYGDIYSAREKVEGAIIRHIGRTYILNCKTPNKYDASYSIPKYEGICKQMWFSIKDSSGKYVTSGVVDRIMVFMEMTCVANLSITEATILAQSKNGMALSEDHIFIKFGEDGNNTGMIGANNTITFIFNPQCNLSELNIYGFMILYPELTV